VRKVYGILFAVMLLCLGCQWQLKPNDAKSDKSLVTLQRYDRIESLYLTTGDYAAMQQMNTYYPMQTRMLIENVLQLGKVDAPDINTKFLYFFQDSTLQHMLRDVQQQYGDMDDVSEELEKAFTQLKELLPDLEIPEVYTQIGSFDQSIIVGNQTLGISLDKYLGADYPFYVSHYTERQRSMMTRSMIVPDCLSFYILSLYPLPNGTQQERDQHMGNIQWVVNKVVGRQVFDNEFVKAAENFMNCNSSTSIEQFLLNNSATLKKND
jgi:hypothetical protein